MLKRTRGLTPDLPQGRSRGRAVGTDHPDPFPSTHTHSLVAVGAHAAGLVVLGTVHVRAVVEGAVAPAERSAPTLI